MLRLLPQSSAVRSGRSARIVGGIARSPSDPRPVGHSAKRNARFHRALARLEALSRALDERSGRSIACWVSMQRKFVRALTERLRCASVSYGRSHHFSMIAG